MTVVFDTNVLLDVLLKRAPHDHYAVRLFTLVEGGSLKGVISASSVPTVHYLASKVVGARQARTQVSTLLKLFDVAPLTRPVLEDAVQSRFKDYEDAVIHEAARHFGAEGIVTRNGKDFADATLRVYSPEELARMFQASSQ